MLTINYQDFKIVLMPKGYDMANGGNKVTYWYRVWDLRILQCKIDKIPLFDGIDFIASPRHEECSIAHLRDFINLLVEIEHSQFKLTDRQKFWLKSMPNRIQTLGEFGRDLDDMAEIADELYLLSNDDFVEWSEWVEDDEEAYFPIRLQYLEEDYYLWYGDPSFDTGCRGDWGSASITKNMTREDCLSVALEMQDMALETQAIS